MYWNTVSNTLREYLNIFMSYPEFKEFRLVGGTALSLQLGHRISMDIDLFSDAEYGLIDFDQIEYFLNRNFKYTDYNTNLLPGMGKSYFVGNNPKSAIKLDIYYTDKFIWPATISENIRMASIEEIIAMKIDVVTRVGRKKDFWDLHELLNSYSIEKMLNFHQKRYQFNHNRKEILKKLSNFETADEDPPPNCLLGKHWELIKLDIIEVLEKF